MTNTFELRKGKMVFEDNRILITDNAGYLKRSRIISALLLIGMGIYNYVTIMNQGNQQARWTGLLIGILGLLFLIAGLRMNIQNEIFLSDVLSMKVRRLLFKEFLVIKLKNNRTRRVTGIYNAERLEEYLLTISLPDKY